jgi:H+/Cl- antiporter ClcA
MCRRRFSFREASNEMAAPTGSPTGEQLATSSDAAAGAGELDDKQKTILDAPLSPQPNIVAPGSLDRSLRFWTIVAATGLCGGLAGGLLMRLLRLVQHAAWSYDSGSFLDAVARTSPGHRILVAAVGGLVAAIGLIVLRLGKQGNAQEISVAIWFRAGETPLARTLGRAILSIVVVGLGAAVGREGALKQAGAAFAYRFASWARLDAPTRRLITACGAGAGLAAAYNLPIGGGLFALEVLLGTLELPFAIPAIACSIIGSITSWALLPASATYVTPAYELHLDQILWALLIGPAAGLLAVPYIRLITWSRMNRPRTASETFLALVAVMTALGAASTLAPQLLGNGRDVVQRTITGAFPPLSFAVVLMFARPLATALCLKAGAPGGLFTPTMTFGALLGDLLGRLWAATVPGATPAHGGYAVIAAGAFLAACTSAPLSAIVIMLELGRHIDLLIVPMALAAVGAGLTARLACLPSIYSATVEKRLASAAHRDRRGAADDCPEVPAAEKIAGAIPILLHAKGPVYVIDHAGRRIGRLDRSRLPQYLTGGEGLSLTTAGDLAERLPPPACSP